MTEKTEKRAKLFRNGGSQAVRLPKEFQFEGTEVRIFREGQCVVLEPVQTNVEKGNDAEAVAKF
jgi:antitoxin VapB